MHASGVPLASRGLHTSVLYLRGRRATFCSARGVMYVSWRPSGVPLASRGLRTLCSILRGRRATFCSHHAPCRAESRAPATQIEHRGVETTGRQRDARGVHHAPCRAESRAPATQNRAQRCGDYGTPEGRQRRTSRPLQSRKSRACHAK